MTTRVPVSERIYRALLRLYPTPFRDRFSDEMVQLFGDQLREARTDRAGGGVGGTWLRTIGDLIATAPLEHLRRDRTVAHTLAAPPAGMRALGIAGILGGLVVVASFLPNLPWTADWFNLRLVVFNAGAIAIAIAVTRRRVAAGRRLALAAAIPAVVANAWYLILIVAAVARPGEVGPGDYGPAFALAAIALWTADAVFGFAVLRLGVAWRPAGLALGLGSILAMGGMGFLGLMTEELAPIVGPLALFGVALNGAAWIALGVDVATRRVGVGAPAPVRLDE